MERRTLSRPTSHQITAGDGPRIVALLHGFPQTWWEWRRVIPELVDAGLTVIAPDYRGAGHSGRPARRLRQADDGGRHPAAATGHLGLEGPIVLVGHDIGLMVAYAYAQAYRYEVSHLVVVDAPLSGTDVFDRLRGDPRCLALRVPWRARRRGCSWRVASGSTSRSSWVAASIRRRSMRPTSGSTSRRTRPLARCGPASRSTAPLTATPQTTGQCWRATAN